jgi:hypothetical protein
MPNTKPIGVAYEDQLLDGARFTPEVSALTHSVDHDYVYCPRLI